MPGKNAEAAEQKRLVVDAAYFETAKGGTSAEQDIQQVPVKIARYIT
jgi:histidinol-phosphate/aromatic aminotransferase/cobyric acid decarboxylase-like protein